MTGAASGAVGFVQLRTFYLLSVTYRELKEATSRESVIWGRYVSKILLFPMTHPFFFTIVCTYIP